MGKNLNYALACLGGFLLAVLIVWFCTPLTVSVNRTLISLYVTTISQAAIPFIAAGVIAILRRYPEIVLLLLVSGGLMLFYNMIALWVPMLTTSYL